MTSSRVVRGTKGRIFLCICAILIITGIIACYNNTLSQLDDIRRANDQCHQQQENLSTQLQVIFDYKQRLEKSLKTEKAEHQQSKKVLESRIDEDRSRHEKATNEANLKFSSLQQHYNLLQTQHDDFKEECSKIQQQQLNEISDLQSKLKEVQGQLKQSISEKENSFEHLKTQFLQLQVEKDNLEKQIKGTQSSHLQSENELNHLMKVNHELQRELDELKAKCSVLPREETILEPQKLPELSTSKFSPHLTTNFSKQVDVGNSVYQIRDFQNHPVDAKQELSNVADLPSNADDLPQSAVEQVDAPKTEKQANYNEQVNNNDHVLAAPNNDQQMQLMNQKSSTTKSSSNSKAVSKASLDAAQPLHVPTVTPSNLKNKPSQESRVLNQDPHVLPLPYAHRKLPVGVVPVPDTPLETAEESKGDGHKAEEEKEKDIREDVHNAFPNRYRTNLILNELANENKAIEADKQEQINEVSKDGKQNILKSDVGDKENNALEVFDPPNNEKERGLDADPFGLDNVHNSDKINMKQSQQKLHKQHINALGLDANKLNEGQAQKVYDAQDGGDYDKDVQNDMQLEENDPEAEDDDPDYADQIARQKDPAVRN